MHLTVNHVTHFKFAEPATHSIQYIRMTPRADLCQRVRIWDVAATGRLTPWTDGFDNHAHVATFDGEHDEVRVTVIGEITTSNTNGVLPMDDGLPPYIFLTPTDYTEADDEVRKFAAPVAKILAARGALDAGHALMAAVAEAVAYQPGHTTVETKAAEALAAGKGVCQDQAHLFIAAARHLGLPARYVSGYLAAGSGNESHLASHAWAETLIDGLGWVSFDPANDQCATEAYIRLALGLDYGTACPIRGLRDGGGVEEMDVNLRIEEQ
ncbi:MAG: transglutaminase family protein [Rhodospirillales bacterium CG15_BIG_FIL_POST_REV_8_21_14_020_66_15]|nr:MAG: transglutaminase family protein [Rhodospirillales bacterium CG15_BIG_FIL_POST_REV_8_21_14_020_66_15]